MGSHTGTCQEGEHQICSFYVGGELLDSVSLKDAPGADDEGLDRGSGEVGFGAKIASLWWPSISADDRMDDMKSWTRTRLHKLPFEKKFKILGHTFDQARRTQDSLEERMQSENTAWWRDVKSYRSNDVPWRIKCRRMVEQILQCVLVVGEFIKYT